MVRKGGAREVGRQIVADLVRRVEVLRRHPEMGRVVPEFGQPFLRELVHPPFRIVYRREPARVWVVRVWRGERQLELPTPESSRGS